MDSRQNFNVGQEVLSSDLVNIGGRIERGMLDYFILNMLGGKQDAFFKDSLSLSYLSASTATLLAGLGIQNLVTESSEPDNKPVYLAANTIVQFDAADATNDRIDIVCVKGELVDGAIESRKFKDANTSEISNQNFVIVKEWQASAIVVKGTPAGSPAAPATPAGYLRIQSVLINQTVGISSQSDITDERSLLPFMSSSSVTGSQEYDAIVGDISEVGVDYATLKAALDVAQIGWKILVKESETLNTTPDVLVDNVEIVCKPGVTFTKGTAVTGLVITGDSARITGMRFKDFSGGGDVGISVTGDFCSLFRNVFNNCTVLVEDNSTNGISELASIEEA